MSTLRDDVEVEEEKNIARVTSATRVHARVEPVQPIVGAGPAQPSIENIEGPIEGRLTIPRVSTMSGESPHHDSEGENDEGEGNDDTGEDSEASSASPDCANAEDEETITPPTRQLRLFSDVQDIGPVSFSNHGNKKSQS